MRRLFEMRQVRKNAKELRMKSVVRMITFQAKPYQTPGNGSDRDIFYNLSQETTVMTGNMLSLIGSAKEEESHITSGNCQVYGD